MFFSDILARKRFLLSDGAFGTELSKKGLLPGDCPELLNADNPTLIAEIVRSFVDAGSDIVMTNTFGGNPVKLARYGLESRMEELNEKGVRIAVETAGGRAAVFASIGSTGEFLEPLGTFTESDMVGVYARQVRALVSGGAEGFVFETMTDLGEILCALKAAHENSDLPAVASMTFDRGIRGYATMMGITPDRAAAELEAAGSVAVGANCGTGIVDAAGIARAMRPHTGLPLWMKPNAGLPELIGGHTVYRETPEMFGALVPDLVSAGAVIVGGCCGAAPDHIRSIRSALDRLRA